MIDLQQYKSNKLAKFNQLIVLDLQGKMMQSCNAIFDATTFLHKSILKEFPFIESIFEIIKGLKITDTELLFSKVEKPSKKLTGFYDFTFSKLNWNNKEFILWSIYDFTALYRDLINYQQRRNELEINRQHKERLLNLFSQDGKQQPYLVEMITALRQRDSTTLKSFDLTKVIQSVESAFSYQPKYEFQPYQIPISKPLNGDVTWFKFLLYNTLESILATFERAKISINIQSTEMDSDIFVSFRIVFNGITLNPKLIQTILSQQELIDKQTIGSNDQYLISKLYNVQKTVNQQNGYLELQQLDENFENIKATLLCNFNFKQ
jgi:hypothetical protein